MFPLFSTRKVAWSFPFTFKRDFPETSCNVSIKSKLQHAPLGIPREFDTSGVPGRREFDYQSPLGGGEFDPHALGVGNLNSTLDFM